MKKYAYNSKHVAISKENWGGVAAFFHVLVCMSLQAQFRDMIFYHPILPPAKITDPLKYAEERLKEIPMLRESNNIHFKRLGGTINLTFLLMIEEKKFVLRLTRTGGFVLKDILSKKISHERINIEEASSKGFASKIQFILRESGVVVMDYMANKKTMSPTSFNDDSIFQKTISLLRKIHDSSMFFCNTVNVFDEINLMSDYIMKKYPECLSDQFSVVMNVVEKMQEQFESIIFPLVPCHNDTHPGNFLAVGDQVKLIDWEFSGYNDAAWDLARLSSTSNFKQSQDERMLKMYGSIDCNFKERFRCYKALQPLWGSLCMKIIGLHGDNLIDKNAFMRISENLFRQATKDLKGKFEGRIFTSEKNQFCTSSLTLLGSSVGLPAQRPDLVSKLESVNKLGSAY